MTLEFYCQKPIPKPILEELTEILILISELEHPEPNILLYKQCVLDLEKQDYDTNDLYEALNLVEKYK